MKILVTAASKHGATAEIAAAIGEGLRNRGHHVVVVAPELAGSPCGYDAVVLGSALYAGHWLGAATDLGLRSGECLRSRPVWLFSSGPVGDPSRKLVQKMTADPVELPELLGATHAREHRTFPGRLERRNLPFLQRLALFFFRGLQGDFRDWKAVDAWTAEISAALDEAASLPPAGRPAPAARRTA